MLGDVVEEVWVKQVSAILEEAESKVVVLKMQLAFVDEKIRG